MSLQLSVPQAQQGQTSGLPPSLQDLSTWLAALPVSDAVESGQALLERLKPFNRSRIRITLRQDATELFLLTADELLPELEARLADATVPLSPASRSAASVADELLTELASSYKLLLVEQARRLFGFASSGRALLPVVRAMALLSRRLTLSYRMYASNPSGVWSELHQLYQFAARRGLASRVLGEAAGSAMTIYRDALLLAFADPLRLMQGDLDRVESYLACFGELATLNPAANQKSGQGLFLVKPQRDLPGYALSKRSHPVPHPQDVVLSTLPVAERLLDHLAKLAAGQSPESLGLPAAASDPAFRDLMGRLVKHWGAVPNRRFSRLRTHARVEICVGLRGIWDFLARRDTGHSEPGEWMVTNESPRGFALVHVSGRVQPLKVGEVIGLRTHDDQTCHVCVVRWVLADKPDQLQIGLEELAPTARPVSMRKLRGDDTLSDAPILLLPEVPSLNKTPALLAPVLPLDTTCELDLGELQSKLHVRATRLLERTASVQVVQFSAVS